MRFALIVFLVLSACGDWPDAGGPPLAQDNRPWPTLVPISDIPAGTALSPGEDATRLAARASALRSRAALMRRNVSDRDDIEALRARLVR